MDMAVTLAVVLVGSVIQGITGFGFALVSIPILMLFQDPRTVIVTSLILGSILNTLVLIQARRHVTLKDAAPLTIGSILGVPFGSYLLTVLSPGTLKLLVAALVIAFSIPLLMGYSRSFRHVRTASIMTGAVAGALQGSTGMGSPPVVLFMANQGISKDAFRGNQVLRSMAASTLSVIALVPSGIIDTGMTLHALVLVPALLIGFYAGSRLLRMVPQALFKKITVLLVAGTAVMSLAGSLI